MNTIAIDLKMKELYFNQIQVKEADSPFKPKCDMWNYMTGISVQNMIIQKQKISAAHSLSL